VGGVLACVNGSPSAHGVDLLGAQGGGRQGTDGGGILDRASSGESDSTTLCAGGGGILVTDSGSGDSATLGATGGMGTGGLGGAVGSLSAVRVGTEVGGGT
jgi:hypothetical protein